VALVLNLQNLSGVTGLLCSFMFSNNADEKVFTVKTQCRLDVFKMKNNRGGPPTPFHNPSVPSATDDSSEFRIGRGNLWDDENVFTLWGSFPTGMQRSPVFRGQLQWRTCAAAARRATAAGAHVSSCSVHVTH